MYGYITPLKVKIVLALALTDSVVKDLDMLTVRNFTSYHPVNISLFSARYSKQCILLISTRYLTRSSNSRTVQHCPKMHRHILPWEAVNGNRLDVELMK